MGKRPVAQKKNPKRARGRRYALPVALLVLLLPAGFLGRMYAGAHTVHLCAAEVYLKDLPPAFEGTTLLFVSDLNIRSASDASACIGMMDKLAALRPDLLILGGDYVEGSDASHALDFIRSLADFPTHMGRLAVTGEEDANAAQLNEALQSSGIKLMSDECAALERDGERLIIAGLSDFSLKQTPYENLGRYFEGDECVIAVAHNPASYIGIRVAEARSGGAWADLVLSGHNLGGQIRLFGRTMRTMPEEEARCLAGWYYADDLPILVSQGVGCKGPELRFGSRGEVWLLTLRRPSGQVQPELPDF